MLIILINIWMSPFLSFFSISRGRLLITCKRVRIFLNLQSRKCSSSLFFSKTHSFALEHCCYRTWAHKDATCILLRQGFMLLSLVFNMIGRLLRRFVTLRLVFYLGFSQDSQRSMEDSLESRWEWRLVCVFFVQCLGGIKDKDELVWECWVYYRFGMYLLDLT